MPPQTPAQKASTSLPFFSRSSGLILSSGIRRTHLSCNVGLRLGLYFLKNDEEKIGSFASMGSKTSLRVAPKKTPTEATAPAAVILRVRLMMPIVLVTVRTGDEGDNKLRRLGISGRESRSVFGHNADQQ